MRNKDQFRGCLVGGAVGDALGYAVEFLDEQEIFDRYGKNGITAYTLRDSVAEISDDTQMTLFTVSGLLECAGSSPTECEILVESGSFEHYLHWIRNAYLQWYRTQTEAYPLEQVTGSLLHIPELFSDRAAGMTCLSALRDGAKGRVACPVNQSKGCGGVMRVAPIGLFFCDTDAPIEESDRLGAEAAALTHGHELGYIPAAALVHVIRKVVEEPACSLLSAVTDSIAAVQNLFPHAQNLSDFVYLMQLAVKLSQSGIDDRDAVHQLGEGWVAEETLAIAVYCALKYEQDFDKAVIAAVNHNGDSDSTGAVCGNLLGAYLGYEAIPQKYLEHLELHDLIRKLADSLSMIP